MACRSAGVSFRNVSRVTSNGTARGAIEWRNEGEVSSLDGRRGGLSGQPNRGSIATRPPMQMPVPSISKSHIQG
jgi:hypothetical protein